MPQPPNSSFKPNALRYTSNMAKTACHVVGSATHVGLTQALVLMRHILAACVICLVSTGLFAQEISVLTPDQVAALPATPWEKACSTPVDDPQEVSLIQLIANPDKFEGHAVTVIGYFHSGFEHSAIYLSKADYQNDVWSNGLWVDSAQPSQINDSYILVTGVFTQTLKGHLAAWPGAICNASELTKWPGHEH